MPDLGEQVAYLVLSKGTPVYSSEEQQVGEVHEVLSSPGDDIFDGLEVSEGLHTRYVKADLVDAIYERGVVLTLSSEQFSAL